MPLDELPGFEKNKVRELKKKSFYSLQVSKKL
jgi:hypothetical protein